MLIRFLLLEEACIYYEYVHGIVYILTKMLCSEASEEDISTVRVELSKHSICRYRSYSVIYKNE